MRIAYVAPYQSPTLLERRSILSNLGLAANVKIELIAELLPESRPQYRDHFAGGGQ